jgi:hypothetical protein
MSEEPPQATGVSTAEAGAVRVHVCSLPNEHWILFSYAVPPAPETHNLAGVPHLKENAPP